MYIQFQKLFFFKGGGEYAVYIDKLSYFDMLWKKHTRAQGQCKHKLFMTAKSNSNTKL
jgi:hypothetical protein